MSGNLGQAMQCGEEETKASMAVAHGPQSLIGRKGQAGEAQDPQVQGGILRWPQPALRGVHAETEGPGPRLDLMEEH